MPEKKWIKLDGPRNSGYVVQAPAQEIPKGDATGHAVRDKISEPSVIEHVATVPSPLSIPTDLPTGVVYITKVDAGRAGGKAKGYLHTSAQLPGSDGLPMYDDRLVGLASECCQNKTPVRVLYKTSGTSGKDYVQAIKKDVPPAASIDINADMDAAPMTSDEISF